MKTDRTSSKNEMPARRALTARAASSLVRCSEQPDLPRSTPFRSDSAPPASTSVIPPHSSQSTHPIVRPGRSFRPTERDVAIVDVVCRVRILRDDQIQIACFSLNDNSGCQRRLTKLVHCGWLDRLPRQRVNDPFVYLLTRRSRVGNRLMRERYGEARFHGYMTRLGSIPHLLGINDVRVRADRACRDLGWRLRPWLRSEDLTNTLAGATTLIPDAHFQVRRTIDSVERRAGFFLELQATRKSHGVLVEKLRRYAELYYGGRYAELFGTRGLRVLVVFTDELTISGEQRARRAVELAEHHGFTFARFAALEQIRQAPPVGLFGAPIWWQPGQSTRVPLFEVR